MKPVAGQTSPGSVSHIFLEPNFERCNGSDNTSVANTQYTAYELPETSTDSVFDKIHNAIDMEDDKDTISKVGQPATNTMPVAPLQKEIKRQRKPGPVQVERNKRKGIKRL